MVSRERHALSKGTPPEMATRNWQIKRLVYYRQLYRASAIHPCSNTKNERQRLEYAFPKIAATL